MPPEPTASEIVDALYKTGYFHADEFDPTGFIHVVEREFNIGADRALAVLATGELTTFEYTPDPSVHPKDTVDLWRVRLTAAGQALVLKLQEGPVDGQTSNNSLERSRER